MPLKLLSSLFILCVSSVLSFAQTHCINTIGEKYGYKYELWNENAQGTACMTLGEGALFSGNWSGIKNYLARLGLGYDQTQEHQSIGKFSVTYNCNYNPSMSSGNSYLAVYGWTYNPSVETVDSLVEYYIIEDWRNWVPSMDANASLKGTFNVNGSIYEIYENTRIDKPSIKGEESTFKQYFSIRRDTRNSGEMDISAHLKKWEELGMEMGNLHEVSFLVEGYQSDGGFEFTELVFKVNNKPENFTGEKGTFIDERDGHEYEWVKIGDQIWMAENLAYLPDVSPPTIDSESEPYYYVSEYYGSSVGEAKKTKNYQTYEYGALYNWTAAMNGSSSSSNNPSGVQGVCPSGWHLPSDAEWQQLVEFIADDKEMTKWNDFYIGMDGYLKASSGWDNYGDYISNGTDDYGFSAIPAGGRYQDGTFFQGGELDSSSVGGTALFWSSTENDINNAWRRALTNAHTVLWHTEVNKDRGYSVRCVKGGVSDEEKTEQLYPIFKYHLDQSGGQGLVFGAKAFGLYNLFTAAELGGFLVDLGAHFFSSGIEIDAKFSNENPEYVTCCMKMSGDNLENPTSNYVFLLETDNEIEIGTPFTATYVKSDFEYDNSLIPPDVGVVKSGTYEKFTTEQLPENFKTVYEAGGEMAASMFRADDFDVSTIGVVNGYVLSREPFSCPPDILCSITVPEYMIIQNYKPIDLFFSTDIQMNFVAVDVTYSNFENGELPQIGSLVKVEGHTQKFYGGWSLKQNFHSWKPKDNGRYIEPQNIEILNGQTKNYQHDEFGSTLTNVYYNGTGEIISLNFPDETEQYPDFYFSIPELIKITPNDEFIQAGKSYTLEATVFNSSNGITGSCKVKAFILDDNVCRDIGVVSINSLQPGGSRKVQFQWIPDAEMDAENGTAKVYFTIMNSTPIEKDLQFNRIEREVNLDFDLVKQIENTNELFVVTSYCPVTLKITAPDGSYIDPSVNQVQGAEYITGDFNDDNIIDNRVYLPELDFGTYKIETIPIDGAGTEETFTLTGRINDEFVIFADSVQIGKIPSNPYTYIISPYLTVNDSTLEILSSGGTEQISFSTNDNWEISYNFPAEVQLSTTSGSEGNITISTTFLTNNDVNQKVGTITINTEHGEEKEISIVQYASGEDCNPVAPTNFTATDGTYCDKIRFTWDAVENATQYKIYQDYIYGDILIDSTANLQYDFYVAGIGGKTYYVVAANQCGVSGESNSDVGYIDDCEVTNDFLATDLRVEPSVVYPGDNFKLTYKLSYSGNSDTLLYTTYKVFYGYTDSYEDVKAQTGSGYSYLSQYNTFDEDTLYRTVGEDAAGTEYYFFVVADYDNYFEEANEENNIQSVKLTVIQEGDPFLNVDRSEIILSNETGANQVINVESNVSWNATTTSDWISIEPINGSNNGAITISSLNSNTSTEPRTATVTLSGNGVSDVSIVVSQTGAEFYHDFYISNPTIDENEIYPGDMITVDCYQEYAGNSPTSVNSYLGYYLSNDNFLDENDVRLDEDVSELSATNNNIQESQILKLPDEITPGAYHIIFFADYKDDFIETDEINNFASVSINIEKHYNRVSISQIQGMTISSPMEGNEVTISGEVIAVTDAGYYLQDDNNLWSGIFVKDNTKSSLIVGSKIEITGFVAENNGITQIDNIIESQNSDLELTIAPFMMDLSDAIDESYESMLIHYQGVKANELNDDYIYFGEWSATAGVSNQIIVDDLMYKHEPVTNSFYEITGIGHYSSDKYMIAPRNEDDVVNLTATEISESNVPDVKIYPNPFNSNLNIEFYLNHNVINATIEIFDLSGRKIKSFENKLKSGFNQIVWDGTNQDNAKVINGLYFIQLITNEGFRAYKISYMGNN